MNTNDRWVITIRALRITKSNGTYLREHVPTAFTPRTESVTRELMSTGTEELSTGGDIKVYPPPEFNIRIHCPA